MYLILIILFQTIAVVEGKLAEVEQDLLEITLQYEKLQGACRYLHARNRLLRSCHPSVSSLIASDQKMAWITGKPSHAEVRELGEGPITEKGTSNTKQVAKKKRRDRTKKKNSASRSGSSQSSGVMSTGAGKATNLLIPKSKGWFRFLPFLGLYGEDTIQKACEVLV